MSYATKEQLAELAAYMASQINVPTIGIGGGYAPIGTIISYMGTTAPQDYLACDGSTKNIADYPQLADFFEAQFGSKNYFGGDGTTTFAVPDLQGEFLRGTGTNSHTNQGSGANVGVHQDGTEHRSFNSGPKSWGNIYFQNASDSATISLNKDSEVNHPDSASNGATVNKTSQTTNYDSTHYTSRPTNTSVLYCIKAVVAGEVYSTDERVVGTWIDGKPLYSKVLSGKFGTVTDKTYSSLSIPIGVINLGIAFCTGNLIVKNGVVSNLTNIFGAASGDRVTISPNIDLSTGVVTVYSSSSQSTNADAYVIVYYTKTTD